MEPVVYSMADAMCWDCQERIIARGWRREDSRAWENLPDSQSCDACRYHLLRLADYHGPITFEMYRGLSVRQFRELGALHEAAHAVVGEGLGLVMTEASMESTRLHGAGVTIDRAGSVRWDLSRGARVSDWIAMATAGFALEAQWQRRNRLTARRYLVDAAYGSRLDMAIAIDAAQDRGEPVDKQLRNGARLAAGIVAEDWDQISAVAEELGRTGRMDRAAVRGVMSRVKTGGTAHMPAPKAPASTPQPATTPTVSQRSTSMGIDEIRRLIAEVEQRNATVASQIVQVKTEIEDAAGLMQQCLGQSSDGDVQAAIGQQREIAGQLEQLAGRLNQVSSGLLTYAGRL